MIYPYSTQLTFNHKALNISTRIHQQFESIHCVNWYVAAFVRPLNIKYIVCCCIDAHSVRTPKFIHKFVLREVTNHISIFRLTFKRSTPWNGFSFVFGSCAAFIAVSSFFRIPFWPILIANFERHTSLYIDHVWIDRFHSFSHGNESKKFVRTSLSWKTKLRTNMLPSYSWFRIQKSLLGRSIHLSKESSSFIQTSSSIQKAMQSRITKKQEDRIDEEETKLLQKAKEMIHKHFFT